MARKNRPSGNWAATTGGRGWRYRRFAGTRLTAGQRRLLASFCVLLMGVLVLALFWVFGTNPDFRFVYAGISAYSGDDQLPVSAGVDRDLDAIDGLKHSFPGCVSSWQDLSGGHEFREELQRLKMNGGTLFFYLSALAVSEDDQPLTLLLQGASANRGEDWLRFSDLLDGLQRTGARRVVLLLDLNRIPFDQRLGIFTYRIPEFVRQELDAYAKRSAQPVLIDVICSRKSYQTSILNPKSGTDPSLFVEQIVRGLQGEADESSSLSKAGNGDLRVQFSEFIRFLQESIPERASKLKAGNQVVDWISLDSSKSPDDVLVPLKPKGFNQKPEQEESKTAKTESTDEKVAAEKPKDAPPATSQEVKEPAPPDLSSVWEQKDRIYRELCARGNVDPELVTDLSRIFWILKRAAEFDAAQLGESQKLVKDAANQLQELNQKLSPPSIVQEVPGTSWVLRSAVTIKEEQRQDFKKIFAMEPPQAAYSPQFVEFLSEAAAQEQLTGGTDPDAARHYLTISKLARQIEESSLPFEVRFLAQVDERVLNSTDGRELVIKIAKMHRELRRFLHDQNARLAWVEKPLAECFHALDRAERWILGAKLEGLADAEEGYKQADQLLSEAKDHAKNVDAAFRTLLRVWVELPYWIRLVAVESEALAEESGDHLLDTTPNLYESDVHIPANAWKSANLQWTVSELIENAIQMAEAFERTDGKFDMDRFLKATNDAATRLRELDDADPGDHLGNLSRLRLLGLTVLSPADRKRIEAWSVCPLITESERTRFRAALKHDVKSEKAAAGLNFQGLWQGYWTIQLLRLGQERENSKELEDCWKAWCLWHDAVVDQKPEKELSIADAHLGHLVRSEWARLERQGSNWRTGILIPSRPTPPGRTEKPSTREVRQNLLTSVVTGRGRYPLTPKDSNYYQELLSQLGSPERLTKFDFKITAGSVELDRAEEGKLEVSVQGAGAKLVDELTWREPRLERIGESSTQNRVPIGNLPVKLRYRNKGGTGSREQELHLIATCDQYPCAFLPVQIKQGFDPEQWKIRFVSVPADREIHQEHLSKTNESLLRLPPQWPMPGMPPGEGGFEMQLVHPQVDNPQDVAIKFFSRSIDGQKLYPILNTKVTVTPDAGPVRIPWAAPSAAGENPPPAKSDAKPMLPSINITHGLEVELTLPGEIKINRVILPAFRTALAYVNKPELKMTEDRLSVTIAAVTRPPPHDLDCFWPESIPVKLDLPDDLRKVAVPQQLEGKAVAGKPLELWVGLAPDKRQPFEDREFEFSIDVAGIPHAFRWRRRWGNADEATKVPEISLVMDPPGPAIQPSDKNPLQLRMLVDDVDSLFSRPDGAKRECSLHCEYEADGNEGQQPFPGSPWKLSSPYRRMVELQPTLDGLLQLHVKSEDFTATDEMKGLNSRIRVRAWLAQDETKIAEADLRLAVTDGTPPVVKLSAPSATHEVRPNGKSLELKLDHRDFVAGVKSVRIGFDTNKNGKLEVEEESQDWAVKPEIPASFRAVDPKNWPILDENGEEFLENNSSRVTIPIKALLELPLDKTYAILCIATDGAGVDSKVASMTIQLVPPAKIGTPMPTTGKLKVTFKTKKRTLKYSGPDINTIDVDNRLTLTLNDLKPGLYKLEARDRNGIDSKAEATVEAGKTGSVQFP